MRLDTFLAEARLGTKLEVKHLIWEGSIAVNGEVVREAFFQIEEEKDKISYFDKVITNQRKVYYMFHKPGGCITARTDQNRKTIYDYFGEEDMTGVFPVGRLDKDTQGLLLLTNDGAFNHSLMNPGHHVQKKYFFLVLGKLDESKIRKIEGGVELSDGKGVTLPAKIETIFVDTLDKMQEEYALETISAKQKQKYGTVVTAGYITIEEGRKHQVREMLLSVCCHVCYLKRESIGQLTLDEELKPGQYRSLTEKELSFLK